ncbi:MAG: hypothetical protein ACHQ53_03125 [Polyangiales bacterium]|jgi:hypothetical protein
MPRKKKAGRTGPNKTAFVLGLPRTTPASEVVAKAKAQGIELTDRYVYVIRSKAKGKAGKPSGRRGRPPKAAGAKPGPKPSNSASHLATQFVDAALDLGLHRAEELLGSLRAKLRHAIG